MPIRISDIHLPLDHAPGAPEDEALQVLGLAPEHVDDVRVRRRSIDARRRHLPHWVYQVDVHLRQGERTAAEGLQDRRVRYMPRRPHVVPEPGAEQLAGRVVVVGAGPAGLFAAYRLAQCGYRPLLLERGRDAQTRLKDLRAFRLFGQLDPESNLLFGEGGAGMYSDGKLTTRRSSPLTDEIRRIFHDAGAEPSILHASHPHLGSNFLPRILRRLRTKLTELGVEVRFGARVSDVHLGDDGRVRQLSVATSAGTESVDVGALVLAVGGSARDTFALLRDRGVALEARPILIGVRVEHPQALIDRNQYGPAADHPALPSAEYFLKFAPRGRQSREVHSFCMCPGGEVIAVATEPGRVSSNGASNYSRASGYANSALIAPVPVRSYGDDDLLAGVEFQRRLEAAAFAAGGRDYALPAQSLPDFYHHRGAAARLRTPRFPRHRPADVASLLPKDVGLSIRHAMGLADDRIDGFLSDAGTVYGLEMRTASPVRITRNPDGQSRSTPNLYPAGEGAGYAGGIMSAAIDGMEQAEQIVARFAPAR